VIHRLQRSRFLRPRERLYELIALEAAEGGGPASLSVAAEGLMDRRTLSGYLAELEARGLLDRIGDGAARGYRLTEAGRRRLHYLLVDYVNELAALHQSAWDILRRSLAPLSLAGARRVAFYPHGETAEVAYGVLQSLDLELVAIVDDSPRKWDLPFHHLRVRPPEDLVRIRPEAVVVTTSLFQEHIVARIRAMELDGVRIQTL